MIFIVTHSVEELETRGILTTFMGQQLNVRVRSGGDLIHRLLYLVKKQYVGQFALSQEAGFIISQQMGVGYSSAVCVTIDEIINRHINGGRDILMCQEELIEAGYAEWAKL